MVKRYFLPLMAFFIGVGQVFASSSQSMQDSSSMHAESNAQERMNDKRLSKKSKKSEASQTFKVMPGNWQPLSNPGQFGPDTQFPGCGAQLLLTDGTIMVFNLSFPNLGEVWKLTPDEFGSYINGTWSQLASLPEGYAPYAHASAVLPDGRVIIEGGEYNGPDYALEWTSKGAIYDPVANTWTPVAPPSFFNGRIGDASSVILPDGTFMLQGQIRQAALLNPKTLTWKETGTATKWDCNDEEGWVLLPNGKVLTVDASGVNASMTLITTDVPGVGPFMAFPSNGVFTNNVAPENPIVGPAAVASPDKTACSPINDLTGKIGICFRGTICSSGTIVPNMEAAHALAVIMISNTGAPFISGGANGIPFSCTIGESEGNALVNALKTNPNMQITLTQTPAPIIANNSEIYNPKTGKWKSIGNTIVPLNDPLLQEQGPPILRPDGTVFWTGSTFGTSAIFHTDKNIWTIGPKFPEVPGEGQLGTPDAPAALLPNGHVLVAASSVIDAGTPPTHIFEFDGSEFVEQPTVPNAAFLPMYVFNMMVLPTGQIMMTDSNTTDVEIFTAGNLQFDPKWAPVITSLPKKVSPGNTYKISGIRFNGMSQGSGYGDDYQSATNYPLVRITNEETGHVFYCRTHDHSFMGVASNKKVHTFFDVPANIESGKSKLEVVANGIPSEPIRIKIK